MRILFLYFQVFEINVEICVKTNIAEKIITRMHSSRTCTTCLLPISPSMHCSRGGVPAWVGYPCPGGVPAWGVYLSRGLYLSRGYTCPGGVCLPGVYLPGVYLPGGYCPGTPLWTEWQTSAKILPCSKLRLWAVKIGWSEVHWNFSTI